VKKWPKEEVALMLQHYAIEGAKGIRRRMRHRTLRSIQMKAIALGLSEDRPDSDPRVVDNFVGLPATSLTEQLECVRLRKWRGPINAGPLVPSLGRRAA
jgi:hypothetical protein